MNPVPFNIFLHISAHGKREEVLGPEAPTFRYSRISTHFTKAFSGELDAKKRNRQHNVLERERGGWVKDKKNQARMLKRVLHCCNVASHSPAASQSLKPGALRRFLRADSSLKREGVSLAASPASHTERSCVLTHSPQEFAPSPFLPSPTSLLLFFFFPLSVALGEPEPPVVQRAADRGCWGRGDHSSQPLTAASH